MSPESFDLVVMCGGPGGGVGAGVIRSGYAGTFAALGVEVHYVVGEQATELVHIGLMARLCEAGADLFNRACCNFPSLGDLHMQAACDAMRRRGFACDATAAGPEVRPGAP